jgi:hypothetical protein
MNDSIDIKFKKCPGCHYMLTQMQIDQSRFDYLCPRCEDYKISEFVPVMEKRNG